MSTPADPDLSRLPQDIRDKVAELDLELSEGDITQKGYDKKRKLLLAPYEALLTAAPAAVAASPGTKAHRRHQRRLTRDEGRFHSEIRAEAVQQALAEYAAQKERGEQSTMLAPIKRRGTESRERSWVPLNKPHDDSSSDDEDSLFGSTGRNGTGRKSRSNGRAIAASNTRAAAPPDVASSAQAAEVLMRRVQEQQRRQQQREASRARAESRPRESTRERGGREEARADSDDRENTPTQEQTLVDDQVVYANSDPQQTRLDGRRSRLIEGAAEGEGEGDEYQNAITPLKAPKVSLKIQQLLNSLQRPRAKPLQEFYNDDDAELEAMARVVDPSAPRPEGAVMCPVRGEQLGQTHAANSPRSVDAALSKHGAGQPKATAAMLLDQQGKIGTHITYAKLLSRANKVAFMLLNKQVALGRETAKQPLCRPGDRVALVYPNTEPLHFLAAFYGCMLAGVVPVPVEVPLSKRDAGIQQLGFLLGSCAVRVALTSDACYKGLPKTAQGSSSSGPAPGDVIDFKGWPRLHWCISESLGKPARDWSAAPRVADDSVAYVEYATDREGAVKGVCVSRQAALSHARALCHAMGYAQGETMVCVLDWKREAGLWHSVLAAVYAGMRVVFVPYSLMKVNPASWMVHCGKLAATTALVKSRDLHWALLATRDHKDVNLSSLRSLLVADGANPWSLSSCDQFAASFAARGLRPDALCPCAGGSETGTISIRRKTAVGAGASGRGILSMSALSHSVVRVDQENSLTSLTLQDAGQVVPGGVVVVVKQYGPPRLCRADEVGEICVWSHSCGSAYWGLEGQSASTFRVEPLAGDERPLGPLHYVRSGLIGFMGPDGLVFVVGRRASQLHVSGRQHSADDIIATVLAVEPMRFVYRGRIAVFATSVLRDERVVIVAEQKPGTSEEESFNWMSRVLQAIDSIHQVGVYCLALVAPNQLPKTPLGGIHVSETRARFVSGELHPSTLLMCPHSCVLNLPKPREQHGDVGPAAMFVGNIVQGVRMAGARGRPLGAEEEPAFCLLDILRSRATATPDHQLLSVVTGGKGGGEGEGITCQQLLRRAEKIGALFSGDKARLNQGEHVALLLPPSLDLVAAFYGCMSAGLVPVCVRPPQPATLAQSLPEVRMVVDASRAVAILTNAATMKLLKSKEACAKVDSKSWPVLLDVDDTPSSSARKRREAEVVERRAGDVCYLDFALSSTGQLSGMQMDMAGASSLCKSLKMSCELYPSRHVVVCCEPWSGLGLALWCLSSVYAGHLTTLIPPTEIEKEPALWLNTVSALKARDTFTTNSVMELCVRELASQVPAMKERGVNLSCVRTCVAVGEDRPRVSLSAAFSRLFSPLSLSPRALSTSFGCRVCPAICMQGASGPEPSSLFVDSRALRHDRVSVVGKGAPHSVQLMESGKLLPGLRVVIANPDTRGQCADSHLGEVWVASPHNAVANVTQLGGEGTTQVGDAFNARLTTGDTQTRYARTGYLGFLRQTQAITEDGELHDAVFVVGSLAESLLLRGMRYHPADIEASIQRCHKHVAQCAVFTWTHLLVAVAECSGPEAEALDLVPAITSAVLEQHHLIVGVCVVVDPNTVPRDENGQKLRTRLREAFLKDQLDPIYVAYNM